MGFLGRFFGGLWRSARAWPVPGIPGVRIGSPLAVGLTFLILLFGLIGVALVAFGFDLDRVDLWLDAQGGWLDIVGKLIFRLILGVIVLMCAILVLGWLFDRKNPDRPGWGLALGAAVVAWFCSASLFAPL
ncbi:MAG TPA: hypothetical protein VM915_07130 [Verrucomicrobiae bacterium]|nr:hypothetical protein [Verrucomicrobiae bacterium]